MDETDATAPLSKPVPALGVTNANMAKLFEAGADAFDLHSTSSRHWEPPSVESLQMALPQYQITALIACGGMGAVYKGTQSLLNRPVAIKVLPPEMRDTELHFAERFKLEARSMARLSHPHIVAVFEAGETPSGLLHIVMEFVQGTDLSRLIQEQERLPPLQALSIIASVCQALVFAHEQGIIHRDIKPSNIMLDAHGCVKVADFGLAKAPDPEASDLTFSGFVLGTPNYTAPESRHPGIQVDARADLYSTGVMLYQMLTGQLPFGRFAAPSQLVPGLDPHLDALVDRCLQTDRDKRHPTARHLLQDITALQQRLARKEKLQLARPLWKKAAIALVLLTLAASGVWRLGDFSSTATQPPATLPRELGWYRDFPPGQWAPVSASLADSESLTVTSDGWQRLPRWIAFSPANARGTNWAVRATFKGDHEDRVPEILLRDDGTSNFNAYLDNGGRSLTVQQCANEGVRTHFTLATLPLKNPVVKGTPYTLEFAAIGSRLIARVNGETLDFLVEDEPHSGRASVYGIKYDAYRDIKHLNLDGISQEKALSLLGITADTPEPSLKRRPALGVSEVAGKIQPATTGKTDSALESSPPVGVWTRLDSQLATHPSIITDSEGWFLSRPPATVLPTPIKGMNWGIRATFKSQTERPPELILRSSSQANFNAYLETGGRMLTIQRYESEAENRYQTLIRSRLTRTLPLDKPYTIAFYAIGPHLIAQIGDEIITAAFDKPHDPGRVSIYGIQTSAVRDVEVLNLDSLPLEEAFRLAKLPPPKPAP